MDTVHELKMVNARMGKYSTDVKMGIGKLRSRRRRPRRWLGVSGKRQLDPNKMQKQGSRERGKVIKQIRKKRK